jgi:deoxycytidylate deaminase
MNIRDISNIVKSMASSFATKNDEKAFTQDRLMSYHRRAEAIAINSHDAQTKVSALLINPKSGAVISDGYNGFVRGAPDADLPTTRPDKYKYIVHAEVNLLCNAVRHGVRADDCVVYSTLSPCISCVRMLWQAGISAVYYKEVYRDFSESVDMGDIVIKVSKLGDFYRMDISAKA